MSATSQPAKVAFDWASDSRGDLSSIYVAWPDGSHRMRLTPKPTVNSGSWDPVWSPDGRRIAFVSARGSGSGTGIWLMNADGGHQHALTSTKGIPAGGPIGEYPRDLQPAWSPDGRTIAFTKSRNGAESIWLINTDGSRQRQLTHTRGDASDPAWSPDGHTIVFSILFPHGDSPLATINVDGAGMRRLGESGSTPAWSPDGRTVVYEYGALYLYDLRTHRSRKLVEKGYAPSWLPDGRSIVYWWYTGIYVVHRDGTDRRFVTSGEDPSWQPTTGRR